MSHVYDELGDRMKGLEGVEANRRLDSLLPICARVDGRSFSRFTRGFERPFDQSISKAMLAACERLVQETHAKIGFVQSDEINLVWLANEGGSIAFDGRVQKMSSVLASLATSEFTLSLLHQGYDEIINSRKPVFDARVWQVPTKDEAANVLVWRSQDARRNAISVACRAHISGKSMHGMNQADMIKKMDDLGTDYHSKYPTSDRYGVYLQRKLRAVQIDDETWAKIPDSKKPDDRTVLRSTIEQLPIKYFGEVKNRVGVIFDGERVEYFPQISRAEEAPS